MIGSHWSLKTLVLLTAAIAVIAVGCSSNDPDPTPTPQDSAGRPTFVPYIFGGKFTVGGEPGPQGTRMFARLGDARGPFNDAIRQGEYINVAVTPENSDDVGGVITFHIGDPSGPTVQADQTYVYTQTIQPQLVDLDLSFPRLP